VLLRERGGGVVLVSHDRALLAETATELVDLDPRASAATHYGGGWDAYTRERDAARPPARRARARARGRAVTAP
jgi:macrolide transport system ATP-binding/permease protein